jgi:pSer/pThr/pTyr-binding forkhead associated (FHA) protein
VKPPEHAPSRENPVVFLVKKVAGRPNPFGAGVTMGRAEHNDLVFPHASVSRFHAYFTPDPTQIARWNVIDAASRNGTLVDGVPIQPNSRQPRRARRASTSARCRSPSCRRRRSSAG